jgi:hypothetical protein
MAQTIENPEIWFGVIEDAARCEASHRAHPVDRAAIGRRSIPHASIQ